MDLFGDIPDDAPAQNPQAGVWKTSLEPSAAKPDYQIYGGVPEQESYARILPPPPDYLKESVRSLGEGIRNSYENFAEDIGAPTLKGVSGAASTALSLPVRSVFGSDAGFGTAVDAVMNPLTLNRWGDRAERYYDPLEQRFAKENEGIVKPINAAMEGTLSHPYGVAGHMEAGSPKLSTPDEIAALRQKAFETNPASKFSEGAARDLFADIPNEPAPSFALSDVGYRRSASDIFEQSYGDREGTLARMLESPDRYQRSLAEALLESAPLYEEGRTLAKTGEMRPQDDNTPHIVRAVNFIKGLREADIAPSDYYQGHESKSEPDSAAARWVSILYRNRDLTDPDLAKNMGYGLSFHAPYEVQPIAKARRRAEVAQPATMEPPAALVRNIGDQLGARQSAITSDPGWLRQATAWDPNERRDAGLALDSGRGYNVDQHAHDSAVSVIGDFESRLPPGVKIGVLRRVEPVPGISDAALGLFSDAPDFANYVRRDFVSDAAAMWDPNTRRIMISRYGTAPFRSFGHFSEGLQGEVHHEMAHAMSALDLSAVERNALIAHAHRLGVLEVPYHLYAALKRGRPPSQWDSPSSLGQTYAELYKDRPAADRKFMMQEEALAILAELYSHGVIDEADIAPVKPILDRIVRPVPRYRRARGGAVRSRREARVH